MSQEAFQASAFQNDAFQMGSGVDPVFLTDCTLRAMAKLGLTITLLLWVLPLYA